MRALLLCAGLGTRLRPLTDVLPKCLMPVRGRPLLGYWLDLLRAPAVDAILVNTHHNAPMVRDYLAGQTPGVPVEVTYEDTLLGTGGTLLSNREFFSGHPVLLAHGDNLTHFCLDDLLAAHARRPRGSEMTMMTFRTDHPESCGIVELSAEGMVLGFHEKVTNPPGNLANAAVYVLEPTVIEFMAGLGRDAVDFSTEVLPAFIGRMSTFHNDVYHRDIGTVESLLMAQFDFLVLEAAGNDPHALGGTPFGGRVFLDTLAQTLGQAEFRRPLAPS